MAWSRQKADEKRRRTENSDDAREMKKAMMSENLKKNIRRIMEEFEITKQCVMAERIGMSTTQFCHMINEGRIPPVEILDNIHDEFGYTIDELLNTEINAPDPVNIDLDGYDGIYMIYYNVRGHLAAGILLIRKTNRMTLTAKTLLVAGLSQRCAAGYIAEAKKQAKRDSSYREAEYYLKKRINAGIILEGEVSFTNENVFLTFHNPADGGKVFLIFRNEKYHGRDYTAGLGTFSVAGDESDPSIRYAGICRDTIQQDESEIAAHLDIHMGNDSAGVRRGAIADILNAYSSGLQDTSHFTKDDQTRLAVAHIEDIADEAVRKCVESTVSVTRKMNCEWYEFTRREAV